MPAIDECQPQMIRALAKEGWLVTHQPFAIRISKTEGVYADLRLQHHQYQQTIIVVEVKCFPETRSLLDEFYHAVGQYLFYRQVLAQKNINIPLFLAIPTHAYEKLSNRPIMASVINEIHVKIVVVDLDDEEIVLWIP